jgi:endonuclease/exonuclease/phosphatase family metal-dependent hydrolase
VRLATWNLHGSAQPDTRAIASLVEQFAIDLIAAQELRHHQARRLARLLGWPGASWCFKHNGWYGLPRRAEGIALIASVPDIDYARTTLSNGAPWWKYTRRVAQRATFANVRVVNAHLASHNDVVARAAQVERLIVFADGAHVLAGDFNDIPGGETLNRLAEAGWYDVFDRTDNIVGGRNTSPVDAPVRRIDHVLVREHVVVTRVNIPSPDRSLTAVSDHLPVIVDITVPR